MLVGKHGDHVGGELDAFRCLEEARRPLPRCWTSMGTWTQDGTINPTNIAFWRQQIDSTTASSLSERTFHRHLQQRWLDVLFSMSYDNHDHREMMDLEGLKNGCRAARRASVR